MTPTVTDVPWQDLRHAFGSAHDVPRLLTALSQSHGRKSENRWNSCGDRVLHQGSIYSASPAAVQALIPLAATAGRDRKLYYEVLAEFAFVRPPGCLMGRSPVLQRSG